MAAATDVRVPAQSSQAENLPSATLPSLPGFNGEFPQVGVGEAKGIPTTGGVDMNLIAQRMEIVEKLHV